MIIFLANIHWSFFFCSWYCCIELQHRPLLYYLSWLMLFTVLLPFFPFVSNRNDLCFFLNPPCPPFLGWCFFSLTSFLSFWGLLLPFQLAFFLCLQILTKPLYPTPTKWLSFYSFFHVYFLLFLSVCLFLSLSVFLLSDSLCLLISLPHYISDSPQSLLFIFLSLLDVSFCPHLCVS